MCFTWFHISGITRVAKQGVHIEIKILTMLPCLQLCFPLDNNKYYCYNIKLRLSQAEINPPGTVTACTSGEISCLKLIKGDTQ